MPIINSLPPPTQRLVDPKTGAVDEAWYRFFEEVSQGLNVPSLPVYTVATLPNGSIGNLIYVSDEAGGPTPAFFDGTDWRRLTDLVIVS